LDRKEVDPMVAAARSSPFHDTWFETRLSGSALARLEAHARTVHYPAGAEILREGDETASLGLVARGRVALKLRVPERGPTTILTVEAGDVIGWSALVPPHRATSSVFAVSDCDLVLLDGASLRDELERDPELAAAVYHSVLEALATRLIGTRMQLLDLFARPADEPW
jgi:CRP/FNR family transcriptional regulator, cyclic AMP receptor protein